MTNIANAIGVQFLHTRSRRRRARGFAGVANRNAQIAVKYAGENRQLKAQVQQLRMALAQRPFMQINNFGGGCCGRPGMMRGFQNRFMGNPNSMVMGSICGAIGAMTAQGGLQGLLGGSRLGGAQGFMAGPAARSNLFHMLAFNHARGLF